MTGGRRADMVQGRAYIIGGGPAGLSAAVSLLRDGGVPGDRITILEKELLPGGACDGYAFEEAGYIMRGEHMLEDRSACLTELMAALPAAEGEGSLLEEVCALAERDPNYSLCRLTRERGVQSKSDAPFGLSDAGCAELLKLYLTPEEELAGRRIRDVLSGEVLNSGFFLLWKTAYRMTPGLSALELKLALMKRLPFLKGLPDLSHIRYFRYNLYESLIRPLQAYLEEQGVEFRYGMRVTDVAFDCARNRKLATRIDYVTEGEEGCIDLTEEDLVFITLGSCVENASRGSGEEAPPFVTEIREGGSFDLWRRIAAQDSSFGHPEVFAFHPEDTAVVSATISTGDTRIISAIKKLCRRDPYAGRTVTGGIVTAEDSPWLLSWSVPRQPLFREQPEGECVIWLMGLEIGQPGSYVNRPMKEATGDEICMEWLYHLGIQEDLIEELARERARTIPVQMPFALSPLLPREPGDRPDVVPEGAENFAFLGEFAESEGDAAGTVEYAVRTGMEAVSLLLSLDRRMPDAFSGAYDLRVLFEAAGVLRDGRNLRDPSLRRRGRSVVKAALKLLRGTDLEKLLRENKLV